MKQMTTQNEKASQEFKVYLSHSLFDPCFFSFFMNIFFIKFIIIIVVNVEQQIIILIRIFTSFLTEFA